jgi:3-oxoisoapionate kinase
MSLLLSYYGDDFTGSTDVMEALASHGIKTVLFTRLPAPEESAQFAYYQAIGLAGTSRSQTPEWMDEQLPPIFEWLKSLNAKFCHYKVCSTFDSSPKIGSIGRAVEIGRKVFNQSSVPLIIGAPQLKRYTFAGHLFAAYQGQIYRIDRHPVMSQHPVTPMDEADLRVHLARQSQQPIHMIDVYDDATQLAAGEELVESALLFVVGSSGVEYALAKAMMARGDIEGRADFSAVAKVDHLLVVSGSVSPTTERQIRYALSHGFIGIEADVMKLADKNNQGEINRLVSLASEAVVRGASPIVFTALGLATDRGGIIDLVIGARHRIGQALGSVARVIMERHKLSRLIIAGGDSSSHALGELDVFALTTRFPLKETPGSPLCIAHSSNLAFAGLEIALKGGQVGGDDYFVMLRDGTDQRV